MIEFSLLSMWIFYLYFSDSYFNLYGIYKFAGNLNCIKIGVQLLAQLGAHGLIHPATDTGPRGPLSGSNGERARAHDHRVVRRRPPALWGTPGHGRGGIRRGRLGRTTNRRRHPLMVTGDREGSNVARRRTTTRYRYGKPDRVDDLAI